MCCGVSGDGFCEGVLSFFEESVAALAKVVRAASRHVVVLECR